ncbi:MAG: GNAT family N-acetyltransferase [Candidatus Limnocylindrales bacterium]
MTRLPPGPGPTLRPPDPPLRDGDVMLRPFRPSDAEEIAAACQDPEIQQWVPVPVPYTLDDAIEFVAGTEQGWRAGSRAEFAIVHAGSGELLGAIGVGAGGVGHGWSVGYWVAPEARGLGIATRAVRLAARWVMGAVPIGRLELVTLDGNLASQRVAERAGFQREGVLRAYFDFRGQPRDVVLFSLLAGEAAAAPGETYGSTGSDGPNGEEVSRTTPIAPTPSELTAPGTAGRLFVAVLDAAELPPGSMRRMSRGDLDLLLAHTASGIVATDDRCPHLAAPLSIGVLDGCVVDCPLHQGRFDLCSGEPVRMPSTGGLDPDGTYHPAWSSSGSEPKPEPPSRKLEARRLTRVRRLRFYPVRLVDGRIEVALPQR